MQVSFLPVPIVWLIKLIRPVLSTYPAIDYSANPLFPESRHVPMSHLLATSTNVYSLWHAQ